MWVSGSHRRQLGWAAVLLACAALLAGVTFKVNTIKSQVRLAEREIIALESEKRILEIEFQARSNQQQLADLNRIEYGYAAPSAGQYLESERQLAALGMARAEGAPEPIRVAQASTEGDEGEGLLAMVSPITGKPAGERPDSASPDATRQNKSAKRPLSERLSTPDPVVQAARVIAQ